MKIEIKEKPLLCCIFGHSPTGQITGFRNVDGHAITRCKRCNIPIVSSFWVASKYIMKDLYGL